MKQCEGQISLFSAEASRDRASRSALPGTDEARQITVSSGLKCLELSKSSGPLGCLEKTLLAWSGWHSTACCLTWKVQATPAGRLLFQLAPSMPHTDATDSRLLPTPTASDTHRAGISDKTGRGRGGLLATELARRGYRGKLNPEYNLWLMGFPKGWTSLKQSGTP